MKKNLDQDTSFTDWKSSSNKLNETNSMEEIRKEKKRLWKG